jgi:hypothetical protein
MVLHKKGLAETGSYSHSHRAFSPVIEIALVKEKPFQTVSGGFGCGVCHRAKATV